MTRAGSGFALRKISSFHLQDPSSHLGIPSFVMHNCLAENTKNLSYRSCQTVIETLSPGWSQSWPMATKVIYCGIIVEERKALGATFVCITLYTAVENSAYTNDTRTIRTIKTDLCHKLYTFCTYDSVKYVFLNVLRGEVSTVGEHSCMNG